MSGARARIAHRFVRSIPDQLEPGILYVSLDYVTTSHLCACGCDAEVVLPLHPTKWQVTFDGSSVTMSPSVGSRTLPCRSHYLIANGRIVWADPMSDHDFEHALARDRRDADRWHGRVPQPVELEPVEMVEAPPASPPRGRPRWRIIEKVRGWFGAEGR